VDDVWKAGYVSPQGTVRVWASVTIIGVRVDPTAVPRQPLLHCALPEDIAARALLAVRRGVGSTVRSNGRRSGFDTGESASQLSALVSDTVAGALEEARLSEEAGTCVTQNGGQGNCAAPVPRTLGARHIASMVREGGQLHRLTVAGSNTASGVGSVSAGDASKSKFDEGGGVANNAGVQNMHDRGARPGASAEPAPDGMLDSDPPWLFGSESPEIATGLAGAQKTGNKQSKRPGAAFGAIGGSRRRRK